MTLVLLVCQLILILVLSTAAISKLINPYHLFSAIEASFIPRFLIHPLLVLIIIAEIELALGLAFSTISLLPILFGCIILLLSTFTLFLIILYYRRYNATCGCFGAKSSPISIKTITRNIIFIGFAFLGMLLSHTTTSILLRPSPWVTLLGAIFAGCIPILLLHRKNSPNDSIINLNNPNQNIL